MTDWDGLAATKYGILQQQANADTTRANASANYENARAAAIGPENARANAMNVAKIGQMGMENNKLAADTSRTNMMAPLEASTAMANIGKIGSETSKNTMETAATGKYFGIKPDAPPTTNFSSNSPFASRPLVSGGGDNSLTRGMREGQIDLSYSTGTPRVPGHGDGTVDTVDAKLAPGEAVLNKAAAEMLGRGLIDLLNKNGMLKMGMPDPQEEAAEEQGYACGTSNVQHYATGSAYVEPLAVQRAPVPQAATFTLGMMGGNQSASALGGRGWADAGAVERARTGPAPAPMLASQPPIQPINPIPTIDHGPAPSAPDQSATAWGNRPAPAPAAPPVNTGWADSGRINYAGGQTSAAPAAPGASAPPPRMISGMTGVAPQSIPPQGQRPTMPAPAPSPINNNMSFDQAFKAARDAAGGAGGQFSWHGKDYQTNVKGEAYSKAPKPVF